MDFWSFSDTLKKLADRVEEKVSGKPSAKHTILNRIDMDGFKQVQEEYINDRSLCKKTLEVLENSRVGSDENCNGGI